MTLRKRKQPVVFAGENHLITLYHPGSDDMVAAVSCWRCTYSAHGEGFVLAMMIDPAAVELADLPPTAIYTDNEAMGRMVVERFNQYFAGFRERGLADLTLQTASFAQQADGQRRHQISCASDAITIELVWQSVFDAALELFDNTSGPEPYDVSAVICPCRQATISVNGTPIQGEVHVPDGGAASSAFLAFSETWVAR